MSGTPTPKASPWATAQGVYRIVGPDGRVSYSDQPPPASANAQPVAGVSSSGSGSVPLPNDTGWSNVYTALNACDYLRRASLHDGVAPDERAALQGL